MRNRPERKTENELGQALDGLADRVDGESLPLADYLRLLLLRDETDDGQSSDGLVVGWTRRCKKEKSDEEG